MIITQEQNDVQTHGLKREHQFRIKATGKAFRILSSGLYADKISAIIRELSCNAYDAHKQAKTMDKAFEITLPTYENPVFRIRDYGTGLSNADVRNIFTTYFESTKTDSNDFVGCLGLGSKTPFSYVDSYTVISYFNGKKTVFNCFINEDELPTVAEMASEKTDEPNGLEISFAVRTNDFSNFTAKAEKVYKYFKFRPVVSGVELDIPKIAYAVTGNRWGLRDNSDVDCDDGAVAIMGNVAYPLSDLKDDTLTKKQQTILQLPIDIEFDIGELEVAASRESLSYTKATVKNIIHRLDAILGEINTEFEKKFDSCKSLYEARLMAYKLFKVEYSSLGAMFDRNAFTWKGQELNKFNYDLSTILSTDATLLYFNKPYSYKTKINKSMEDHINLTLNTKIFIQNKKHTSVTRCKSLCVNTEDRVYLICDADAATLKAIRDALGMGVDDVIPDVTTIPWTSATRTGGGTVNPKNVHKILMYNGGDSKYTPAENFDEVDIDLDDTSEIKYYLPMSHYKFSTNCFGYVDHADIEDISNMLDLYMLITGDDVDIYGVKPSGIAKITGKPNWKRFDSTVKDLAVDFMSKHDDLIQYYHMSDYEDYIKLIKWGADHGISDFVDMLDHINKKKDLLKNNTPDAKIFNMIVSLFTCANFANTNTHSKKLEMSILWEKIVKKYPLLKIYNSWAARSYQKEFHDYMILIDKYGDKI